MGNEVFNFGVLRSADRRLADEELWIDFRDQDFARAYAGLTDEATAKIVATPEGQATLSAAVQMSLLYHLTPEQQGQAARAWLAGSGSAVGAKAGELDKFLLDLDRWLVEHKNRPAGTAFEKKLLEMAKAADPNSTTARALILTSDFVLSYFRLFGTIYAAFAVGNDPRAITYDDRQRLTRLLAVASLVLRWIADERSVDERREIATFLRFARVRLSKKFLDAFRLPNRLVRRPGFIDHYVVSEQWTRYELGELADVNSVMSGEMRKRVHMRLEEFEEQTGEETERVEVDERDLQTENQFELSAAAHEAQAIHAGAEGNVQSTIVSGPATTVVSLGGNFEYSSESSRDSASKHTRDILEKAANTVNQRTLKVRSSRQLTRTRETNEHTFDNKAPGSPPVNGIYRWVDKVDLVSLRRYPRRYVIEFVLPEPGAWLKWALTQRAPNANLPIRPAWPSYLNSANDIYSNPGTVGDYLLAAKDLGATDIPTKPERRVLGATISREPEAAQAPTNSSNSQWEIHYSTEARISVPDGYRAVSFTIEVTAAPASSVPSVSPVIFVGVGDKQVGVNTNLFSGTQSGTFGDGVTTGQIPIYVVDINPYGFAATITVVCEPTEETMVQWQQAVFDRFQLTYQRSLSNYESEIEALKMAGELSNGALSAGKVSSVIPQELKRQVLSLLKPALFPGPGVLNATPGTAPSINPDNLSARAPEILFFEQAFEWSTISYILYPYYWARSTEWATGATVETANPEFDAFVNSGSARVVVAARPGFEEQVQLFLEYGVIWGAAAPPAPGDETYLSVAEEIMDLQRAPADGELVETWEIRLPTSLTALDPAGTFPLTRP